MKPLGMQGNKLISDILIDKKINQFDKEKQLVLVNDSGEIISLLGLVISENYRITKDTKKELEIRIS